MVLRCVGTPKNVCFYLSNDRSKNLVTLLRVDDGDSRC
uniref:Uncharacterized protein n=1 Tax=Schistosoma mansoni TaxID=6183 RepID=A0A913KUS4_SCHMA